MTIVEKLRAWADRLETTALPVAVIVAEARALADEAEKEAGAEVLAKAAELPAEPAAAELPAEPAAAELPAEDTNEAGAAGSSKRGKRHHDSDGN
jgi:hypothetical protein